MNAPAPAVRQEEPAPLVILRQQLEQRADEFRMVLPEHISAAKFQRTLLTAVQLNPDLMACDRRSFLTSCMKAAQDGLLPDGREAAIVPFKTRIKDAERGWIEVRLAQYMPMVFGLRKKILQSAEVSDLFAAVVYRQEIDGGFFHYEEGSERQLRHRPILDADFVPNDADIALAYSVATFANGLKSFEVMRRWEIDRVREASQTGAAVDAKGNPREAKGPWKDWFAEMAKKTVIRRHSKSLPQSGDVIVRDVESEDMGQAAARATVALLDSRPPDPARRLPDADRRLLDDIDRRTLADDRDAPATGNGGADYIEPAIAPPDEMIAEAEEQLAERGPEPETPNPAPKVLPDDGRPEPETTEVPGDNDATDALEKATDENAAQTYIARARRCSTIVDLRALVKAAELDLALMPAELAASVDLEFDNARKRLVPEKAGAS